MPCSPWIWLPEEAAGCSVYRAHQLDSVFLTPTTTEDRIAAAAEFGSGYLYYVSPQKGCYQGRNVGC